MPTDRLTLDLIKYIVCFSSDHGISLTTIRLVKFLYLADLYFARWHEGKTFTGYPWAFVYYGPYCSEAMANIDQATQKGIIARNTYESCYGNKDFAIYTCPTEDYLEMRKSLPIEMVSELQAAMRKYGSDTAQLLDYVYFDTEPMMDVIKGDKLDFAKARKPIVKTPLEMKKISRSNVEQIKSNLENLGEKFKAAKGSLMKDEQDSEKWKDGLYHQALDCFDQAELKTEIDGTANIII